MSAALVPDRRVLVAVDMEKYSRQDNLRQFTSQQTLRDVLQEAAAVAGQDRAQWMTQSGGDGELAILSPGTPELAVLGKLVPALDRLLRESNRGLLPEAKVRLRVAVHQGLVHLNGANGFPGSAVVDVCRLCDSQALKSAMQAFPSASVGLIVSDRIYQDVIVQGYVEMRSDQFRKVRIHDRAKNFRASAWIVVPGVDMGLCPDFDQATMPHTPGSTADATASIGPAGQPDGAGRAPDADRVSPPGSGYHVDHTTFHGPTVLGSNGTAIGTQNLSGPR